MCVYVCVDYKEEQAMEVEALESIYMDEFKRELRHAFFRSMDRWTSIGFGH